MGKTKKERATDIPLTVAELHEAFPMTKTCSVIMTQAIVEELSNTNVTESRAPGYCVVCNTIVPTRFTEHIKHVEHKTKADSLTENQKLLCFQLRNAIGLQNRLLSIDIDHTILPETIREHQIHKFYLNHLARGGIPVKNRSKIIEPQPESVAVQQLLNNTNHVLHQHTRLIAMQQQDRNRPSTSHGYRDQAPEDSVLRPRSEAAMGDLTRLETSSACNVLEEYEEIVLPDSSSKAKVHMIYSEPLRFDLMYEHSQDVWNPNYVVQKFVPKTEKQKALHIAGYYIRIMVSKTDQPLLFAYEVHVISGMNASRPYAGAPKSAGKLAYISCVQRYVICFMRITRRFGQIVTYDDCLFSYRMLPKFLIQLKALGLGPSTQLSFIKALIDFVNFLKLIAESSTFNKERTNALNCFTARLTHALGIAKKEEAQPLALKGSVVSKESNYELYSISCGLARHKLVTALMDWIYTKAVNKQEVTIAHYNFFMSNTMYQLIQFNTSRNELVVKLLSGGVHGDPNPNKQGAIDECTGLRKITFKDGRALWVSVYPSPKQGGGKKRNSILNGFFAVDAELRERMNQYATIREMRLRQLNKESHQPAMKRFFVLYNGEAVSFQEAPWLMKSFLKLIGMADRKISCNQARHQTAQHQFDKFLEDLVANSANQHSAFLAGHGQVLQTTIYVSDPKLKAAVGFFELRRIEEECKKKYKTRYDLAMNKVKLIKIDKGVDTNMEETMENEDLGEIEEEYEPSDPDDEIYEDDAEMEEKEIREQTTPVKRKAPAKTPKEIAAAKRRLDRDENSPDDPSLFTGEKLKYQHDTSDDECTSSNNVFTPIYKRIYPKINVQRNLSRSEQTTDTPTVNDPYIFHSDDELDDDSRYSSVVPSAPPISDSSETEVVEDIAGGIQEGTHITSAMYDDRIRHHNRLEAEEPFTGFLNNKDQFLKRRYQKNVQGWTWLKIGDVSKEVGKGVFARTTIRRGSVVADYFGKTVSLEAHFERLDSLKGAEKEKAKNYFFEHKFNLNGKEIKFGIEADKLIYGGTAVIGRYINHSAIHANVEPRFYHEKVGDNLRVVIYFVAKRDIERNEQILYNYGPPYSHISWFKSCSCHNCLNGGKVISNVTEGPSNSAMEDMYTQGISLSQSLYSEPVTKKANSSDPSFIFEKFSMLAGKQLYLSGECKYSTALIDNARSVFGGVPFDCIEDDVAYKSVLHTFLALSSTECSILLVLGGNALEKQFPTNMLVFGSNNKPGCVLFFWPDRNNWKYATTDSKSRRKVKELLSLSSVGVFNFEDSPDLTKKIMESTSIFDLFKQ